LVKKSVSGSFLTLVEGLPERFVVRRPIEVTPTCMLFLAEDRDTRELLTLSVLRPELLALLDHERVRESLEDGGRIGHPGLEGPVEVGFASDLCYYTAPHRRGWTVRDKLAAHGAAPPGRAVRIVRDVAAAVAHAHERGMVHLLLAPDQLLLAEGGILVRGLGLGAALAAGGALESGLPSALVTAYTAPELRSRPPGSGGVRADVYGLGALCYELLVGHPPAGSTLGHEALRGVVRRHNEVISTGDADTVSSSLADLVVGCLAGDPAHRPDGVAEILREMEALRSLLEAQDAYGGDQGDPDSIGPYRILERLGEGGMGTVYRALRQDGPSRPVALKIIRPGMDTREVVRRFERESEALSLLDHENVARIYHASISEGGRPYFVMEVVEGLPITDFADANQLDIPARLALLEQVCRGVQHAHQKGVIHRDLKPSNVLVTTSGSSRGPKVIDFGLAKVMRDAPDPEGSATRLGQAMGTPEYMSPEQATGAPGDVDTRTDIYSLGVIAFELLTGMLPESRAGDPPTPSAMVSRHPGEGQLATRRGLDRRALRRALRGDLDAIVLRCLEADRARRYPTAQELADDLSRHRQNLPVMAQPPSSIYRARKFVRRHRLGVAMAGVFSLVLVVALGVTTLLWTRAEAAEVQAAAEARAADQALALMTDIFQEANPLTRVGEVSAREVLDRGWDRIKGVDIPPLVRAKLLTTMGGAYMGLGSYPRAEEALREVLDLWQTVDPAQRGNEELRTAANLGGALMNQGRFPEADSIFSVTIPRLRNQRVVDSLLLGRATSAWATTKSARGQTAAADSLLATAQTILETAVGPNHEEVARVLVDRADLLLRMGQLDEAVGPARRAARIMEAASSPELGPTSKVHSLLGRVLAARGEFAEAEIYARKALEPLAAELGPDDSITQQAVFSLAFVLELAGRPDEAAELYRGAASRLEAHVGPEHPNVAIVLSNLGGAYTEAGRFNEARPVLERAHRMSLEHWGTASIYTKIVAFKLAKLDLASGDLERAVTGLEDVLAFRRANFADGDLAVGDAALPLSRAYLRQRRVADAEPLAREVLEIFRRHLPPTHPWIREAEVHLDEVVRARDGAPG
jgi:non-specific serine/threonine protein kinase/serine/threonine-protein kinase